MANKQRGEIKITLDKERVLKFNLNSLVKLEEIGVNVQSLQDNAKISDIRSILWAGLVHEDKDLTLEMIGDMVDMDNLQEVTDAIAKAFGDKGKK
ncbi:MAG: hypothetical protein K0S71_327 [Clostridia bacterium]|jgi:hypothetical protein|nr:hypothetical protein [Clostridia bacterium]